MVDLSSLTIFDNQWDWSDSTVQARNGGVIRLNPFATRFSNVDVIVTPTGNIEARTIELSSHATLLGSGTLGSNVMNSAGLVDPGPAAGVAAELVIHGTYEQDRNGRVRIEVGSHALAQLDLSESARLNGTLELAALTPLVTTGDNSFRVIAANVVNGPFENVPPRNDGSSHGHLGKGQFFEGVLYEDTSVTVQILQAAPGDTNGDRVFDQRDVVAVLQAGKYFTGRPADWAEGDWNDDATFGPNDIVLALQTGNYLTGQYTAGKSRFVAVPEPTAIRMCLLAACLLVFPCLAACHRRGVRRKESVNAQPCLGEITAPESAEAAFPFGT